MITIKVLEGPTNWVVSLAFSPDVRFLISGVGDSTARIWACESGKEIGRVRFPGSSTYVESVGFVTNAEMAFALAKGRLILVPLPRKHASWENQHEVVP